MYPLTTRLWCTELLLRTILTTPTPIRAMYQVQPWHGARGSRWVPPLGVLGAAIGAIAIGTVATSTSTTIIISIRTTISTAMSAARDKVIGSTIRNTAEMLRMETGKRRINSADVAPVAPVASVVPEDPVALAVPENPVVPGPETAPAVGELELVRAAVAPRIRLGTAAHRRGLVPVPKRVEDLAVAAETTREPAATEAATAWAAEE